MSTRSSKNLEKESINGTYALEDYGALRTGDSDDRVAILSPDTYSRGRSETGSASESIGDTFFRDGRRRIDFVLIYEEPLNKSPAKKDGQTKDSETVKQKKASEAKLEQEAAFRRKYIKNLRKIGLELEEEKLELEKKIVHCTKIHCPWDVLCYYAEDLCLRAPLQAHPNPSSNWSGKILAALKIPNLMQQDVPNQPLDYYTCQFKKSKLSKFLNSENTETFFLNKDRQRVVYEILASTTYGKRSRAEVGIDRMLEEGTYAAAYPLHDGPAELPPGKFNPENLNTRQLLYEYWARWGRWYKYQPLDHIRDYFGEKIGIYFAWLGFYTAWLLPASIVGLIVFLYGVISMQWDLVAKETCDSGQSFKMCPLCDESIGCEFWYLSDVCVYTTISYLFDHPLTVFYAVFVSFWAVSFLEYWKRKTASLAHHWDCLDFQDEEERPRPEYTAKCPTYEKNPITGAIEPYFPPRERVPRILSGIAVIIIMMVLVIIFIIAVILYRVLVSIPLFQNTALRPQATLIASTTSAIVNLILIMALGKVYQALALKLTQWEMHRTQSEFEDQLIFKVFLFQFVNFYSSIIYVGFFKGKFVGYPGHYNRLLGLRAEECQNGGCLIELAQQLAVIMIGKQMINNAQELLIPKIKAYLQKWKRGKMSEEKMKSQWEEDFDLIDNEGLFEEYLEMVLQFGFITVFVAAFPLAPLFALLNNWLEIRLDASKLVCETRRPVAERAQDIGVWFTILDGLAQLAVISNAFLIAFTSEFLPKLLYQSTFRDGLNGYVNFTLSYSPPGTISETCRYKDFRDREGNYTMFYYQLLALRFGFVIVFEHVVFGINKLIDLVVPDVPESLELKIKRERYLAKQALADTDTIMEIAKGAEEADAGAEPVRQP